jgi:hypothetical protein
MLMEVACDMQLADLCENREGIDAGSVLEQLSQQLRPLLPLVHEHQLQQRTERACAIKIQTI